MKELDAMRAKRHKRGKRVEEAPIEEKSNLHSKHQLLFMCFHLVCLLLNKNVMCFAVKDAYDYQGRSFLHIPQDVGVNLRSSEPPDKCVLTFSL